MSAKPEPKVGQVWEFQDKDGRVRGCTTGPLFHVDSQTVRWVGFAECVIILLRDRLVRPHPERCDCPTCAFHKDKPKAPMPPISGTFQGPQSPEPAPGSCYGCGMVPPLGGKRLCRACLGPE